MIYFIDQNPSKFLSLESILMENELILLMLTVKNRKWLCIGI